ncbi:hypothetical protein D8B26_003583 [Coccidioides posadasii str. Silveira]|uniref:uncharacterized protein n=1 Tax=Coccidioides posadasii (strain RMSCC 757 / Silveira) TaxID=443226 RepID=UPI001BEEE769|nr:hypothetical protein D8B26_003583 [Coccidioides posadasii str. Silveira]
MFVLQRSTCSTFPQSSAFLPLDIRPQDCSARRCELKIRDGTYLGVYRTPALVPQSIGPRSRRDQSLKKQPTHASAFSEPVAMPIALDRSFAILAFDRGTISVGMPYAGIEGKEMRRVSTNIGGLRAMA